MPHKRVVIVAGGTMTAELLNLLDEEDYIIGADRGALFLVSHGITPDLSVGDFDSVSPEEYEAIQKGSKEIMSCDPINKDLTDSELALDLALGLQPESILMTGVTGSRLDQTLAAIQMMTRAQQRQVNCTIVDAHNYITLTGSQAVVEDRGYTYVSLLPLTPEVTGITLEGFQYPLDNATLKLGQSLAVSNRLLGATGTVAIESGLLLILQSKD
ncbi:thiamine diphosphokinase [Paenibacillus sp. NFR01]|uniref:thiamine diphosphokinase n=1 Tax=Paenibacillus sp. NFR01 TaxID=1566279 RepID=UPI0008D4D0C7|nr:thiamine diphosphokinase [Paenibacillus sp. NFR01]SET32532.1 thiamine pyrophosphokinase [Paenibacillus sp. NFR01]